MKVTEIKEGKHYVITRGSSREKWPTNWGKACGFNDGRQPLGLKFHDGDFIGSSVDVTFDEKTALAVNRVMLDRWGSNLDERQSITQFWDWLEKEHPGACANEANIEKLLDEYHHIDRKVLDQERRALLERQRGDTEHLEHGLHPAVGL